MAFVIKQQAFEGPLDLLLSLIEKRKLFINDVSLAQVTDDYISHVRQFESYPIPESANFILIASTLLLIKSKSLLPTLDLTQEEQGSIQDLEYRLKVYARIKELSIHVKERFGKQIIFARSERKIVEPVFSPEISRKEVIGKPSMLVAIREVIKNLPKKVTLPKAIVRQVMSLEDMITDLTGRIQKSIKMSFKDFSQMGKQDRVHVIVSFLAMLELVKQGVINVTQEARYDDIHMETDNVGVPQY